jgi:hypothetical protein
MDQMVFDIGFDQGIGQPFPGVAVAGPVFGPSLGSVSPVFDFVQGRAVPFYLPAYGGRASARGIGDGTHGLALFQGDSDLLTFFEGQMGIAFFLNCAGIEHNGITPC